MLVNQEVLAKIAAQMGYKPFVSKETGKEVNKDNYVIDFTVLGDFLCDFNVGSEVDEISEYELNATFTKKYCREINRARKISVATIISETSDYGELFLTPEIIDRVDVLCLMIDENNFDAFLSYIAAGRKAKHNSTFELAKQMIEGWFKDNPIDYIELLHGRIFEGDYETYYSNNVQSIELLNDVILAEKKMTIIEQGQFGGVAIHLMKESPIILNLKLSIQPLTTYDSNVVSVMKWQLALAGIKKDTLKKIKSNLNKAGIA